MDSQTPKISIIIPSYNSGAYISQTLASIDRQDYTNYEVIVIDGKSTDNTIDIINQHKKLITTFISEIDEGQSHAVNKGFSCATGDFIVWQNADDIFLPGAFSSFVKAFNADQRFDIYFGDIVFVSEGGEELWRRYFSDIDPLIANYHGLICNNQAAFIKREAIEKHGFLDKTYHYAMDREFFLRLYRGGRSFKHFDYVVAGFRHQPGSKTETQENVEKWAMEHREISNRFGLFHPDHFGYFVLEKISSLDKAIRIFLNHPRHFLESIRRKFFEPHKIPY